MASVWGHNSGLALTVMTQSLWKTIGSSWKHWPCAERAGHGHGIGSQNAWWGRVNQPCCGPTRRNMAASGPIWGPNVAQSLHKTHVSVREHQLWAWELAPNFHDTENWAWPSALPVRPRPCAPPGRTSDRPGLSGPSPSEVKTQTASVADPLPHFCVCGTAQSV